MNGGSWSKSSSNKYMGMFLPLVEMPVGDMFPFGCKESEQI